MKLKFHRLILPIMILFLLLFLLLTGSFITEKILFLFILLSLLTMFIILISLVNYYKKLFKSNIKELEKFTKSVNEEDYLYEPNLPYILKAFNPLFNEIRTTALKLYEKDLKYKNEQSKYYDILEYENEIIYEYNIFEEKFITNESLFRKMFGFFPQENGNILTQLANYLSKSDLEKLRAHIHKIDLCNKKNEKFRESIVLKLNIDNNTKWISILNTLITDYANNLVLGIIKDITNNIKEKCKLEKRAFYDDQTKLYNKNTFFNLIDKKLKTTSSFYLLFIDIDNFKTINDTYGHLIGDKVIKYIGKTINAILGINDIGCRFGGDEFIIYTSSKERSIQITKKLIAFLKKGFYIDNKKRLQIIPSIGIVNYPKHSNSLNGLINLADEAMYKAKTENKDYNIYKK